MTTRKYISEFGLSMIGSYTSLLQQDGLAKFKGATADKKDIPPSHVYMVGRRPRIGLDQAGFSATPQIITFRVTVQSGNNFESYDIDLLNTFGHSRLALECPYPHTEYVVRDDRGEALASGKSALLAIGKVELQAALDFEVLYVGQSYGVGGARSSLERLAKHDTLQGIYAEAIRKSPDKEIWLMLWSFEPQLIITFDGTQSEYQTSFDEDTEHIHRVLQKVAGDEMTEQQQINFTEAALIRYFRPEYNSIYRDTFPNPAHKTYSECYNIDLNAIHVELQTEHVGCRLWSPTVPAQWIHLAEFSLHSADDRKNMFELF